MLDAAEAVLREKDQIIIGNAKKNDDDSFGVTQNVSGSDKFQQCFSLNAILHCILQNNTRALYLR